jgi:hypothetical protein
MSFVSVSRASNQTENGPADVFIRTNETHAISANKTDALFDAL